MLSIEQCLLLTGHRPPPLSFPPGLESPKHYAESLEGLRVIQLVRPTIFNFVVPKLMRTPLQVGGEGNKEGKEERRG